MEDKLGLLERRASLLRQVGRCLRHAMELREHDYQRFITPSPPASPAPS
jgi:hypothetical protein